MTSNSALASKLTFLTNAAVLGRPRSHVRKLEYNILRNFIAYI